MRAIGDECSTLVTYLDLPSFKINPTLKTTPLFIHSLECPSYLSSKKKKSFISYSYPKLIIPPHPSRRAFTFS